MTAICLAQTLHLAVMLTAMTNLVQHTWYECKEQRERWPSMQSKMLARSQPSAAWAALSGHFLRFSQVYLMSLATLLIMVQPTYVVFSDADETGAMASAAPAVAPVGPLVHSYILRASSAMGIATLLLAKLPSMSRWNQHAGECAEV